MGASPRPPSGEDTTRRRRADTDERTSRSVAGDGAPSLPSYPRLARGRPRRRRRTERPGSSRPSAPPGAGHRPAAASGRDRRDSAAQEDSETRRSGQTREGQQTLGALVDRTVSDLGMRGAEGASLDPPAAQGEAEIAGIAIRPAAVLPTHRQDGRRSMRRRIHRASGQRLRAGRRNGPGGRGPARGRTRSGPCGLGGWRASGR